MTASALVAGATEQSSSTLDDKTIAVLEFAATSDIGFAATSGIDSHDQGKDSHDQGKDSHDQRKMDKALRNLYKGLADEFWAEDGNSLARKGERVFKYDARAIGDLLKIETDDVSIDAAIDDIVATIVDIDFRLASAAIAAADIAGADTTKAKESMIKAEEALASGDINKAVSAYGKAWKDATHAKRKRSASGSSSGGKYSVYDVVFVRTDTIGTDGPDFLEVSGSNEPGSRGDSGSGNEGYLFSSKFGPDETFLDPALWPPEGGIMQLHVSCSDVFPGGFGAKSDPAATSQWQVNSIHIVKYKDGVIEKECDVVGAGLPTTPTVTATVTVPPPPPTTTTTTTTTVTVPPPPPTTTTTTTTVTVPPPPPTTTTTTTPPVEA